MAIGRAAWRAPHRNVPPHDHTAVQEGAVAHPTAGRGRRRQDRDRVATPRPRPARDQGQRHQQADTHPRRSDGRRARGGVPGGDVARWRWPRRPAEEPGRPVPVRSRAATDFGRRLGVRSRRDRPAGTPAARRGHRPGRGASTPGTPTAAADPPRGQPRRSTVTIINARPAEDIDEARFPHDIDEAGVAGAVNEAQLPGDSEDAPDESAADQPAAAAEPADEDQALPAQAENLAGETVPQRSPRRPASRPGPATHPWWRRLRGLCPQPTHPTARRHGRRRGPGRCRTPRRRPGPDPARRPRRARHRGQRPGRPAVGQGVPGQHQGRRRRRGHHRLPQPGAGPGRHQGPAARRRRRRGRHAHRHRSRPRPAPAGRRRAHRHPAGREPPSRRHDPPRRPTGSRSCPCSG